MNDDEVAVTYAERHQQSFVIACFARLDLGFGLVRGAEVSVSNGKLKGDLT
jgi:hypothetical protein